MNTHPQSDEPHERPTPVRRSWPLHRYLLACAVGGALAAGYALAVASCEPAPDLMPSVAVQKLDVVLDDAGDVADACWLTLASNTAAGYAGPGALCAASQIPPCPLAGGSDRIRVVVGYDALGLSPGAQPPAPTITETLDGVASDAGASVSLVPDDASNHYVASFTAPSRQVVEMLLGVGVVPGYGYQVPTAFAVSPPAMSIGASVCNAGDCAPPDDAGTAAVGSAVVSVGIPGAVPAAVTVTTMVGGVVQPTAYTVQAATPGLFLLADACAGARNVPGFSGSVVIPTPVVAPGQTWKVCAQWGGSDPACIPAAGALAAPVPVLDVESCDAGCPTSSCSVPFGGGTVVVDVTFPGTTAMSATLISVVDGVEQLPPVTLTFTEQTFDPATDGLEMKGWAQVPVPAAGTTWTLAAQVEDWTSMPRSITLVQPQVTAVDGGLTQPGCTVPPCLGLGLPSITLQMTDATTPEELTLTWFQNQAPVGPSQLVSLNVSPTMCGTLTGTASLPLPAATGSDYELWWQLGTAVPQPVGSLSSMTVASPSIVVQLNCGPVDAGQTLLVTGTPPGPTGCVEAQAAPCGATSGNTPVLQVTAPAELQSTKVQVATVVDGVSSTVGNFNLSVQQVAGGATQLQVEIPTPVPDAGLCEIDTTVDGVIIHSCFMLD